MLTPRYRHTGEESDAFRVAIDALDRVIDEARKEARAAQEKVTKLCTHRNTLLSLWREEKPS